MPSITCASESDSDIGDVGVEGAGDGDNAGGVIGVVVVVAAVGCVSVRGSHVARIRGMWDSPLGGLPVSKPEIGCKWSHCCD